MRHLISTYYGFVTEIDDMIGRILKTIDEMGIANDTMVVFAADHSDMLGSHGMMGKHVHIVHICMHLCCDAIADIPSQLHCTYFSLSRSCMKNRLASLFSYGSPESLTLGRSLMLPCLLLIYTVRFSTILMSQ